MENAPTLSLEQFASFLKTYLQSGEKLAPVMGSGRQAWNLGS